MFAALYSLNCPPFTQSTKKIEYEYGARAGELAENCAGPKASNEPWVDIPIFIPVYND